MLLHFGHVPVLVASSADAACEIMKNQDLIFSNRPNVSILGRLTYGFRDVAFAPYGEYWRQVRSICVLHLLNNKRVQSFRRVREEETSAMIDRIGQLGSSSSVVNLTDVLVTTTNNVFCRVALGRKYGDEDGEGRKFKKFFAEFVELLGTSSIGDYISWLGWTSKVDNLDAKVEKRENKDRSPVEDETIKAIIQDMFAAGTDTTFSMLEWSIAELIRNPRTMNTLQNEVREVAGAKEEISEDDLEKCTI
ncbi:UNVERIFIED_CONTAM: cytochrome [Sesamum angustifolium]|uniref:Cytochrome n=1 Tax=Sesamum angustifolium TaxID=2727405 RepID=A0AAW2LLM8_9LAMI